MIYPISACGRNGISFRKSAGNTRLSSAVILMLCITAAAKCYGQLLPEIKPPAPKYLYSDMEIQSDQFKSSLTISAQMPVSELERQINKQLSGLLYEDKSYEDDNHDNLKAKVWKLDEIRIQAQGNYFLFDVPLKIWASAGYKISPLGYTLEGYRDTEFKIRVRLISEIRFSTNWQIVTNTRVDSYDWITEPTISVAGFSIPIKGMISRMLNRNAVKITAAIDKEVKENFQVKDKIEEAWLMAQQPSLLSETYHTWLINTPEQVEAMQPDAQNGFLNIKAGIQGYTQTIISKEPPVRTRIVKLPPLRIVDNLPHSFNIGLISSISYQEASRIAESYFNDKTYRFSGNRYAVQVRKIELYGQDEHLIIKAGLSGSINGNIYLKGIPQYNAVSQTIYLEELEYDLNTRNVLIKAANWLLHAKFLRMMKEAMVFPIAEELGTLTETIRGTIASQQISEGITLKGKLNEALPDKISLTPDYIYTVIHATGNLDLHIDTLSY